MNIRVSTPINTRPCAFSLALQDDSVFADFDIDESDLAFLVRISFDGYGCCLPSFRGQSKHMSMEQTEALLAAVAHQKVHTFAVSAILQEYFVRHQDAYWTDAMIDRGLIPNPEG